MLFLRTRSSVQKSEDDTYDESENDRGYEGLTMINLLCLLTIMVLLLESIRTGEDNDAPDYDHDDDKHNKKPHPVGRIASRSGVEVCVLRMNIVHVTVLGLCGKSAERLSATHIEVRCIVFLVVRYISTKQFLSYTSDLISYKFFYRSHQIL